MMGNGLSGNQVIGCWVLGTRCLVPVFLKFPGFRFAITHLLSSIRHGPWAIDHSPYSVNSLMLSNRYQIIIK